MMAFAVWKDSYTFSLLDDATQCVLAVPGEKLADASLFCGMQTGRNTDKVSATGLSLIESESVAVPGIRECIANIEMQITHKVRTGDHMTVFGQVLKFGVDSQKRERCLLSVGPDHSGYEVLARHGVHRIGVVQSNDGHGSNKNPGSGHQRKTAM
jgi:flavin reductase (DIM6/NTAB) family NADH-FMN oxidoreductase RutF